MRLCLEHGVQRNALGFKDVDQTIREYLQNEKEKHEKEVSNKKKKSTWFGTHSKKFLNKTYTDLDTTNLLEIIPRVTEIRQENKDPNYQSLWDSIREIKNIRNDVVHVDNNATYSDQTITRISAMVTEIVDKLGKLFVIGAVEVDSIKEKFHNEIKRIQDSQQTNEDNIKCEIAQRVINENSNKWAPMVIESMQFETLQFGNELVSRSDIFYETDFEIILVSRHYDADGPESQEHKTFVCTDILSMENNTNIDIIEGDPGSGKSTFLRMMSIEFCKKQSNSIFKSIASYPMMILINCRDKENIGSFWQFFEAHYTETTLIFPEKWVVLALREMKMIIAIDGLDEADETSNALVRDVIHSFAGSETVRFLITTRPGFSKSVVEQFDKKAIKYRVLNIKPIVNIDDQEKFIIRVIKQMPTINVEDIIKTFRTKHDELNSHFLRPIGLILFVMLFQHFPEKIEKLTHELSLLQLSFELHSENMTKRMSDALCNSAQCSRAVLKLLGQKSLQLIQNKSYEIDHETFKGLTDECYEMEKNIPIESVISCVLMKRKCAQNTIKVIYDFSHRSQQEYFASKVLTEKLLQAYLECSNSSPKNVEFTNSKMMNVFRKLIRNEKFDQDPNGTLKILQELTRGPVDKQDLARCVF